MAVRVTIGGILCLLDLLSGLATQRVEDLLYAASGCLEKRLNTLLNCLPDLVNAIGERLGRGQDIG